MDQGLMGAQTGMYGYNKGEIEKLRDAINNAAKFSAEAITDILKEDVVMKTSYAWYAPEAVTFFEKFADIVKNTAESYRLIFDSFRQAVQTTGTEWANSVGSSDYPVLAPIDDISLILPIDDIKDKDYYGNVGLNEEKAKEVINSLPDVQARISEKLDEYAKVLDAQCAFFGGSQSEKINECFRYVGTIVSNIFSYLSGNEDSLAAAIQSYIDKYIKTADEVSGAYSDIELGVGDTYTSIDQAQ